MPTYRAFPLDIEGNIIGPGENLDQDSDYDMRTHGQAVLAAGGYVEIWRGTVKVFPPAAVQTGVPSGRKAITVGKAEKPAVGPASSPKLASVSV